ncbi:acyl-CoA desaturase [Candidatus Saccharibacteria bacterium]|nr:acyl-CoA desaturase [Candidatus Saccharibacteria bacterium]
MTASTALTPGGVGGSPNEPRPRRKKPLLDGDKGLDIIAGVWLIAFVPTILIIAWAVWAQVWGINVGTFRLAPTWLDLGIATVFYLVSGWGVTVGFHRYFTHSSFMANRPLKIVLAIAGQLAVQGSVIVWVADHRRHHRFSDKAGDPHSPVIRAVRVTHKYVGDPSTDTLIGTDGYPWCYNSKGKLIYDTGDPDSHVRYGDSLWGVMRGFMHAHMAWLVSPDRTNVIKFAPDIEADKDLKRVASMFYVCVLFSLFGPALFGWLFTGTWQGALSAFIWAGVVRMALLHHVTWSTNSICHMIGERPFASRDKSTNFWPLAILSFGESWHNLHHADPTCARHGVLLGQLDSSARVIWLFEKVGWATNVKWPKPDRKARLLIDQNVVPERRSSRIGRLGQYLNISYWRAIKLDRELTALLNAGVVPEAPEENLPSPSAQSAADSSNEAAADT